MKTLLTLAVIAIGALLTILLDREAPKSNKTLILPEEICQATKGDHMQYYERNDTIFLEYTFARKPELQPKTQGQQVTIGENFKQNAEIDSIVNEVSAILKK